MEPFEPIAQGPAVSPSQNPVQRLDIGRGEPRRGRALRGLGRDAGHRPSDRHLCAGGPVRRLEAALRARDAKRRGAAERRPPRPVAPGAGSGEPDRLRRLEPAGTVPAPAAPPADRWQGFAAPEAWSGLDAIAAADRSFAPPAFLSGARGGLRNGRPGFRRRRSGDPPKPYGARRPSRTSTPPSRRGPRPATR